MNIFTENLHSEDIDQYYILTRDDEYRKDTKQTIERIWKYLISSNLIGDDLEKFVKDAQRNFQGAIWQLELTYILNQKFKLLTPKSIGPDIIIDNGSEKIVIDCVASNISGINKVNRNYGQVEYLDQDKRKLRVLESISKKYDTYKKWIEKGIVEPINKFIIAIDTSSIPDSDLVGYPHANLIETVLFGYGKHVFVYNHETGNFTTQYRKQKEIIKENGSSVATNIFEDENYVNISAIIWKNTNFLSEHSLTGNNIFLYKNPIAKEILSLEL
ncbi:hypothetical protein [Leptospira bandrabouensis]|nr:hypothetical protein [Leptospira bandrabouensis]MCG6154123.1 hypothetical protein [Leptospira bandrabouensis]